MKIKPANYCKEKSREKVWLGLKFPLSLHHKTEIKMKNRFTKQGMAMSNPIRGWAKRLILLGMISILILVAWSCQTAADEPQRPSQRARSILKDIDQRMQANEQLSDDSLLVEEIEFFDQHEMFDELKRALMLRAELLLSENKQAEASQYLIRGAALAEATGDEAYLDQICQRLYADIDTTLNEMLLRESLRSEHQLLRRHSFDDEPFPWDLTWCLVLTIAMFGCLFFYKVRLDNELQRERIRRLREQIAYRDMSEIQGLNRLREDEVVKHFRESFTRQRSITSEDWSALRSLFAEHYPSFEKRLRDVHPLSEVEWQVCMLLKLDFTPTDISALTARSQAAISTIRSRLYAKFFLQKGSAADWDRFIASL